MTALPTPELFVDATDHDRLAGVLERVTAAPLLRPFSEEAIGLAADLSRRLRRAGRRAPELQALGFWLRPAELHRLARDFAALEATGGLRAPRGTVFHVPPANVDTIFVYSWLLALLTGNRNVIRVSQRVREQAPLLLDVVTSALAEADHAAVAAGTAFVTYGHQPEVTTTLSAASDVRVIWGGDAAVRAVRATPLPVHAVELTFPDRFSMSALRASAYLGLEDGPRDALAERFFNDAYWFDQMGCSSPRLVVVVGDESSARSATDDFFARVRRAVAAKGYQTDVGGALAKMTYGYQAAMDHRVGAYHHLANEVVLLELDGLDDVRGDFAGGGIFHVVRLDSLHDLVRFVRRQDQTLSHFGFDRVELVDLARALNGAGIDRMVPIGQALDFNRIWDGHDLLAAMTRVVAVLDTAGLPGVAR